MRIGAGVSRGPYLGGDGEIEGMYGELEERQDQPDEAKANEEPEKLSLLQTIRTDAIASRRRRFEGRSGAIP